ncbi:MAG: GAF domain-containing protein [Anaerolineales bacterium]|nr:GAF domain-containing protein [Anaerolineales bacterium]
MEETLRVLLIEDSHDDALLLVRVLKREGFEVEFERVDTADAMQAELEQRSWDVIISDYQMPHFSGLAALDVYQDYQLDIPFVIVSGAIGEETAVVAMKSGAHDFLLKDNLARLGPAIRRELQEARLRRERREALQELQRSEARYRAILEDQTELINRNTLDGTITYTNEAYAGLHGMTSEQLIGKRHADFVEPELLPLLQDVRDQLTPENPVVTSEFQYGKPSGEIVWIQWRDRLILDEDGNPVEYQGVGRDITDRKIAEREFQKFAHNLERRAVQLQVGAEVARDATSARDLDDLLTRAVDLIRERFGFYHAGVFLIDQDEQYAVLTAATGQAGQALIRQGHALRVGEVGIVGHVAATGVPRIALDVGSDAVYFKQPLLPETRSEMALPLKVGDHMIGVLDVQSREDNIFDEEDVSALQTMADQLAIAIDNARLLKEVQRRAQALEGLYETALVTTSILETDALLAGLYQQVKRLIKHDTFVAALYDTQAEEVAIALAIEADEPVADFKNARYPMEDSGLSGWVIRNRQPLLLGDAEAEQLPTEPKRGGQDETRAWLGVPLIAREQVIGAISVQSFEPGAFDLDDQRFLESLAAQVAIALQNARLFEDERAAREQAETLREVARVLSGSLDLDRMITFILEQLKRLLMFDTASVLILDVGDAGTNLVAGMGYQDEESVSQAASDLLSDSKILQRMRVDLKPILCGNVSELDDWIWVPGAEHVRSFLGVPIVSRNKMVGAFMVDSATENFFTQESIISVEALAQNLAIAIETARAFEAERAQLLLARTLQEVGMLLTSRLGLNEVLERILDLLGRVVQYDSVSVQLLNDNRELYLAAGRGLDELENAGQVVRQLSQHNLTRMGLLDQKARVVSDTASDERWQVVDGVEYIRSWIGVPLAVRGRLIGIVTVDSRTPNAYDTETAETVMAFASQAAIAIENTRLFEAERSARERAEALREAAQVVGSTLSLDEVINGVLEQLARVLPHDASCVILLENQLAHVRAGRGYENFLAAPQFENVVFDTTAGTIWDVVQNALPLMIPDTAVDPRWIVTPLSQHTRSWLGVPLRVRDQVIGLFSLDRLQTGGFSEDEISLAQVFATHTAAAIENARLYETTEKRVTELETLRKVSLSLTASLEPQDVLDAILDGVFQLAPDTWDAHIFIYENDRLTFGEALWADGRRSELISEPRQDGLTYSVARSGEMIVVPDMRTHPLFTAVAPEKGWSGAIIGLPLKIGERVIGVLNIAYHQRRSFSNAELHLLRLLGDQAALAIENARLFEQTITERRHIALLYDVSWAIATSFEPGEILDRSLNLTCQALGGNVGAAWYFSPEDGKLHLNSIYDQELVSNLSGSIMRDINQAGGLVGYVAKSRQPLRVDDILLDERWLPLELVQSEARSALLAPILEGDNLLGVFIIHHQECNAFNDDHLDLLQAIGHQVGLALSNAQRYQDIDRLVSLLAAEQYRLETLIEMLPAGVLLLNEDYQILVTNSLAREFLAILSPPGNTETLTRVGSYALTDLFVRYAEPLPVEIVIRETPRRIFEAQARPIGGDTRQWVLTLRDVTQEREIQDRVQMQERLATVGQLAAGIAHDFNNIMAAIVVYADLLMLESNLTSASKERLGIIQQQVQRASSLIRQILDFSRRSVMEPSDLDLVPFLKEMEKLLARTMPETIQVTFTSQEETCPIKADPTRLQQVFMNLAVNARDAMPDGGRLSLHLKRSRLAPGEYATEVPDMPAGDWVQIDVSDTGMGIPQEALSHIFEPFFTTKPIGQGTGLGLAQVYGIVKQHEGFIDVQSKAGFGSTFRIYFPVLGVSKEYKPSDDQSMQLDGSGKTVLLVEDDAATRTALQTLLKVHRYRVFLANNGEEALEMIGHLGDSIDLVISDIVMPKMGGFDLFRSLAREWPAIKVLLITGHPLEGNGERLLEDGKVNWLQKPFSVQEFSQAVLTVMRD